MGGHYDNDTINYLVINKEGAGLIVHFVVNGDDKYINRAELQFIDFFLKDNLQVWGNKPM